MAEQPPKLSREEVLQNTNWRINTLESKIRVNEQNVFNMRKHMQMINHNLLDFKKEMREKLDGLLRQNSELAAATDKLRIVIDKMGKQKKPTASPAEPVALKKDMTEGEASKVLDEILKKGGKNG